MSTPGIMVNPDLTPELVEFWGFKYKEIKQELEDLKVAANFKEEQNGDHVQTYGELKRLVQKLQNENAHAAKRLEANDKILQDIIASSRNEQITAREQLQAFNAEKNELLIRHSHFEAERSGLHHQIQGFYSQAVKLAAEAEHHRQVAIAELFPATSFLEPSFSPSTLTFSSAQRIARAIPRVENQPVRMYFSSRPPSCMPLRVPSVCQAGSWFYPFNLHPMDSEFELIVEGEPDQWLYLGRYVTRLFAGYEMKLSEWMTLDDQTKLVFCARIANQKLPVGQAASYASQIDVRRRYDSGQWSVPCYTLQCVGFNMTLYDALKIAAAKFGGGEKQVDEAQSLGKRHRTDSVLSFCEENATVNGVGKKLRGTDGPERVRGVDQIKVEA
ncbi:hypothetical protein B0H10DRAFT_1791874 [Mycena sp. CBHHK59/15]|nr:hypothetical protein B0H10DRAFT_1791874 [Mycena sp. CBHHK59/15]